MHGLLCCPTKNLTQGDWGASGAVGYRVWVAGLPREGFNVMTGERWRPEDLGFGRLFERIRDAVILADAKTQRIVLWLRASGTTRSDR